jgi:CDP-4-dehydro-6-deoxyglucose reductase
MKARLLHSRVIAPEVRHFVFEALEVASLDFKPGQFLSFTAPINGRAITRAYSIASAPGGHRFELCLNRVREGLFSPHLFELPAGAEVDMQGPLGYFVPAQPFRDSLFIATGTGIAPFRSFLFDPAIRNSSSTITLLFGTRYEEGLLYRDELHSLALSRPGFRYLPTLSRPGPSWNGLTGWVQNHLDLALAGRPDLDVYICGLKAMVNAVRELLKLRGFHRSQVHYEKYD